MKGKPPIDMLRKCRAYFAQRAEDYRKDLGEAIRIHERENAEEGMKRNQKFVSDIDATLRDWE